MEIFNPQELVKESFDKLQSFIDTQVASEKLGRSLVITEVMKAIGCVQQEMTISKNKQGHNYKYADFPSILNICYIAFKDQGLVLSQPMWEDNQGRMELRTIIFHTPSMQWISSKMAFPPLKGTEKNDCQAIGSIQTYWRRYSLLSLIGLDDEDDDGKKADGYAMPTVKSPVASPGHPYSEFINEKQAYLLKSKIKEHPAIGKQFDGVDITMIKKSEFNGILSMFPQQLNN